MKYPNFREEKKLWKRRHKRVAGLDEAGRGPLAGSVMACAVTVQRFSTLNSQFPKIKDSKKLAPKQREKFCKILKNHSQIEWGIGRASEKVIDKINILEATKLAMKRAIKNLKKKSNKKIDFLILDGKMKIDLDIPQKSIIKGDNKVFSCAAASIIAKVTRDRMMRRYDKKYPKYGFSKHKGYATKFHRKMLKRHGPCPIHRVSFKPLKKT